MIPDPAQQEAIRHVRGPCLVLAGPGAGKTHVLIRRIAYLTESCRIPPSQLLVITFTKAAAKEMQGRYQRAVSSEFTGVSFGTFHSIFFQILRRAAHLTAQDIIDTKTSHHIIREAARACGIDSSQTADFCVHTLSEISFVKNAGVSLEEYEPAELSREEFAGLFARYEQGKRRLGKLDFDDMLTETKELLLENPGLLQKYRGQFRYIMVDEAQDTNRVQYDIVRMLAYPANNLFLVGDDDQAIYAFRGAEPKLFLGFTDDYPDAKRIVLTRNYRCDQSIVEQGMALIAHNRMRYEKRLRSASAFCGRVRFLAFSDSRQEAKELAKRIAGEIQKNPSRSIAVLYRNHAQNSLLVEELEQNGVSVSGRNTKKRWCDAPIVGTVEAYLSASAARSKRRDILRIMAKPQRYLPREGLEDEKVDFAAWRAYFQGEQDIQRRIDRFAGELATIRRLPSFAAIQYVLHQLGCEADAKQHGEYDRAAVEELLALARKQKEKKKLLEELRVLRGTEEATQQEEAAVQFSTFHGAKGLEYDHVYILDANEGITPSKRAVTPEAIEEERRMFYVAMTRARHELTIASIQRQGKDELYPSRFVWELAQSPDSSSSSSKVSATSEASSLDSMLSKNGVPSARS